MPAWHWVGVAGRVSTYIELQLAAALKFLAT